MAIERAATRDDRVLAYTRGLSLVIVPFLLVAFVVLHVFPGDTMRLFAWTINPTMTSMVLAAAYLGGAYFFIRVLGENRWNVAKTEFLSVALFASLLGVATILHWDKFNLGTSPSGSGRACTSARRSWSSAAGLRTGGSPGQPVLTSCISAASPGGASA